MINGLDPLHDLSFLVVASSAAAANANTYLGSLINTSVYVNNALEANTAFIGKVGVLLNVGASATGDATSNLAITIQASATNNHSNATSNGVFPNTAFVTTNNANSALQLVSVDTRGADGPFLFAKVVVGGNVSATFPLSIAIVGTQKVQ
jgi:hypothetical protein